MRSEPICCLCKHDLFSNANCIMKLLSIATCNVIRGSITKAPFYV